MSRPVKATVDYFPHVVKHGETMFILEKCFGNDGYAFWFKLLEILGSKDGHYYDLNDPHNIEYLSAKTGIPDDKVLEILDKLALLESIDRELWVEKIVWCQNFVDNLKEVYAKRRIPLPKRPTPKRQLEHVEVSGAETLSSGDNRGIYHQSREEKRKEEERKEEESKPVVVVTLSDAIDFYKNNINPLITPFEIENLEKWAEDIEPAVIIEAMKVAINNSARKKSYIDAILVNWLKDGIKTYETWCATEGQKTKKEDEPGGESSGDIPVSSFVVKADESPGRFSPDLSEVPS